MKKALRKTLASILVAVMVLTAAPLSGFVGLNLDWLDFSPKASALSSSGSCGTNVTYTFDESTGLLTISGTGAMENYSYSGSPFYNNSAVKSVVIDKGVTSIGINAFVFCNGLTDITIPDSVIGIGDYAFENCTGLTSIAIPDSVTSVGDCAFYNCTGLKNIIIPDSVISIGEYAFFACNNIENITVDPNNTTYDSRNDCNAIIETDSDKLILGCRNTVVPDGVRTVGEFAFESCEINEIFLPDSIKKIEDYAFWNCANLENVFFAGSEDSWNKIDVDMGWSGIENARIHYNVAKEQTDAHFRKNIISEPDCECSGKLEISCDCGYSYYMDIPALGHNVAEIETVDPTCTRNGYTLYYCSRCGNNYEDDYVDALGHNLENGICTRCGITVSEIGLNESVKVSGGKSAVFRFTPTESGTYYFFSDSVYSKKIQGVLYDSDMTELEKETYSRYYADGGWYDYNGNFVISYNLEAGKNYYIEATDLRSDEYEGFYVCVTDSFTSTHNNLTFKETVLPGCLDRGYDVYCCTICGKEFKQNYIPAPGHSFENDVCVNCGLSGDDAVESDNPVHGTQEFTIYKPDARRIKITFSKDTSLYGDGYMGELTVSDLTGDWQRTYYYDGDNISGKSLNIEGDTVIITVTNAYFAISDVVAYYNDCEEHINTEVREQREATCGNSGYTGDIYCSDCGMLLEYGNWISSHYNTKEIVEVVEPTCQEGYTVYRCTECGEEFIADYTNSVYNHRRGELIELVPPTCTEGGYTLYRCSVCGEEFCDDWTWTDHTRGELIEIVPPTCAEDGYTLYRCSVCGEEFCDNWTWTDHTRGELIEIVPPTCTEEGYSVYRCSVCGEEFRADWIWTGHTRGELIETVPPTCAEDGYTRYKCSVCGEEFFTDYTDLLGHNFENDVCSRCGMVIEKISLNELKSGNLVSGNEQYYTFTPAEDGKYHLYQHMTEESYVIGAEIFDSGFNRLKSCFSEEDYWFDVLFDYTAGEKYYIRIWNYSDYLDPDFYFEISDSYENHGHDVQFIKTVEPTCDEQGYDLYSECPVCGEIYKTNYTEPLGHTIKNGVCTRCGMEIPEIKPGETKTVTVNEGGQVYYKFVPETGGVYYFYSVSDNDTLAHLYDSDMDELKYDDDSGYKRNFMIAYNCKAGQTYYISSEFWADNDSGDISVCVSDSIKKVCAAPNSGITIDYENEYIYGITSGMKGNNLMNRYIDYLNWYYDCWNTDTMSEYIGTGSVLTLGQGDWIDFEVQERYTFILFGDVNGDGWYDGMDAMIVSCLANGMLTEDDVTEAEYIAADCNHDGVIDSLDVDLLQQAGVLLADVDQSKSEEELLETSSAYVEYLNLIDQTVEDDSAETVVEETTDEPIDEGFTFNIFDKLVELIKMLVAFITEVTGLVKAL